MIKEKRNQFGYTQEEMAGILEISLRQYVRIDKETCLPRSDILDKLISIFHLSNEEIGIYVKTVLYKKIKKKKKIQQEILNNFLLDFLLLRDFLI